MKLRKVEKTTAFRLEKIKKGFTSRELSKRSGVGTTLIYQMERGEANVKLETIQKVADVLGVDYHKLVQ